MPSGGDRWGSWPRSHVLPPVAQHLCGREQKVLLAGLAVVGPLQGRRLLDGFGDGFLCPYKRSRLLGEGGAAPACSHPGPSPGTQRAQATSQSLGPLVLPPQGSLS